MQYWLIGLLLVSTPLAARAAEPVDTALVIAVDVSLSVDTGRYALQRDGTAAAIASPDFARAATSGPNGAIAVTVMEFSDPDRQIPVVTWTRVASAADAQALADKVRHVQRSSAGLTGIANALLTADELFDESPWPAVRRVVDVSGDGMSNIGPPIDAVRDRLVADGITINGLPILAVEPDLDTYYFENVIGGPGAVMIPAENYESFADAILKKLITEIAANDARAVKTSMP